MPTWCFISICVLLGVVVRWGVSLNSYSGAGKAPMFGDYEAQRHWQEITYNLPVHEWYFNTTDNDLNYWGLDYPPLTAYHSLICAHIAKIINPEWVQLHKSRGYESTTHKLFMRTTVLVADVLIYIPAVVLYCLWLNGGTIKRKICTLLCFLIYPGLLLIDYGHFQYNAVSLGFAMWAVLALGLSWDALGSVAFSLALNYKQMELYHALPFFCYLLGKCVKMGLLGRGLLMLLKVAAAVLVTFALCWLPFLSDPAQTLQVLRRIFPVARGLFEDKVANTWCSLNILIKIRSILSTDFQLYLSLACTVLAVLPSCIRVLTKPTFWQFKLTLVNSSLGFFLFSYQVHEKSILLTSLPVCLFLNDFPLVCVWFLQASTFSMLPLLLKDGLLVPYVVTSLGFLFFSTYLLSALKHGSEEELALGAYHKLLFFLPRMDLAWILRWKFYISLSAMACLSIASVALPPPPHLPDLFPVLVSTFSFVHFLGTFLYFNVVQFSPLPSRKGQKKNK
ncbi:dolichyl pyrophosphate Man9GlcNAc2 alpha-1,3-glucosyltransferase [Hippocampus zosterae]|uniref:dolichyl pyrophosphate Man9GlcNAc2 alpha-1,3-glucosyltransferase n=1 Tax=Hippocampus zosterae TaxID=109293 RepID=UPI00223E4341|nr:dolichyl pyrophosphate Man9GlcNAc2 alpha-1,3-glucosyltransferase [Hippocampus zosterae]XP_051929400.1 dolichyl pyrophosphate Man9GlcNAc2 alpha-1,3-glucosyltransferase [Hippocampus zosterae]